MARLGSMLTALPLGKSDSIEIAGNAPWQATRMNLNTFARRGGFGDGGLPNEPHGEVAKIVAERLLVNKLLRVRDN